MSQYSWLFWSIRMGFPLFEEMYLWLKCGFADFEQKSCGFTTICINIFVYMSRPTQITFFLPNLKIFPQFSCFSQSKFEANRSRVFWVMIRNHNSSAMYVSEEKKIGWNSLISIVWVKHNLGETYYWVKRELM